MKRAVHIIIEGLVQGVFYRAFTSDSAQGLNLTGWVRNLKNGTVECEAHGDSENIAEFINLLRKGPDASHVEHLNIKEIQYSELQKGFHIIATK